MGVSTSVLQQETNRGIAACILNMIKFHEVEHHKGLRFKPFMCFIPSTATSMMIQITDKSAEALSLQCHQVSRKLPQFAHQL